MAKLDLEWLAVFLEVYRCRSVSRAAERLNMGQSTASIALGKLRRYFDDPLFIRTSEGMEPTTRASVVYPELNEAFLRLRNAQDALKNFSAPHTRREFRVCMTDISEIVLLPRLINHLQQTAPLVSLETEKISSDSRKRLESGEVDLAVGFMPGLEAGFYQQALFAQDFVCLAAAKHPRVHDKMTKKAFAAEGHIVVTTSGTGHSIIDTVLARHGIERRVVLRVPSFLAVARIVARTELVVIVPRMLGQALAEQENIQAVRPPVALPSYKVKQHWHARFNSDSGNIWLRASLAELFTGAARQG